MIQTTKTKLINFYLSEFGTAKISCRLIFFAVMLSFAQLVCANDHLRVENLSEKDGLFGDTLHKLYRDKAGNLWIIGVNGVARYDGLNIVNYVAPDNDLERFVSGWQFAEITEDNNGTIWLGNEQGVFFWNSKEDSLTMLNDERIKRVTYLEVENDSSIYISCSGKKNFRYNINAATLMAGDEEISIKACAIDPAGNKWYTGSEGKVFREGGSPLFRVNATVNDICFTPQGSLFAAAGEGVFFLNAADQDEQNASFTLVPLERGKSRFITEHTQSIEYANGSIWVGSRRGLIQIILDENDNPQQVKYHYNHPNDQFSLVSNQVNDILLDNEGIMWVATHGGLSKLDPGKEWFHCLRNDPMVANSLHVNNIYPMTGDRKGNMWFGSFTSGIARYNTHTSQFTIYNANNSKLNKDFIRHLYTDNEDNVWVSTNEHLYFFDGVSFMQATILNAEKKPLKSNTISAIVQHPDGSYWMGIDNRIFKLKRTSRATFVVEKKVVTRTGYIIRFFIDHHQRIWAASYSGAYLIDPRSTYSFIVFNKENQSSFRSNTVQAIAEDTKGNIWLGTMNGVYLTSNDSIFQYAPEKVKFRGYFEEDGLTSNYVTGLMADENGTMWLSSWKGITKYDPHHIPLCRFTHYAYADGVISEKFNRIAYFKDKYNNTFYFGGINGVNYITTHTDSIKHELKKVRVTEFSVDGERLIVDDQMEINSVGTIKKIDVSFSSASLLSPKRQVFAWKLEGCDEDWNYINTRSFSLENVVPGNYKLKICAASPQGDLGSAITIDLVVESILVQAMKVIVALAILLVLLILVYRRYQRRKQSVKYALSGLSDDKTELLIAKLQEVMEEHKPYLNPNLTAGELAALLEISSVKLSQLLNDSLETKFYEYINHFRVNEFIQRLEGGEGANLTLMGLAEQCGFTSKSTFYRAFNRERGMTPAQFAKSLKGDSSSD
ncbi:helix-turn-helix domain-containing protein [Puteibacter caeruleilacunae]|nr:helix-turn-helix domain-containing protein [Puteibacter caeruleilacunae]